MDWLLNRGGVLEGRLFPVGQLGSTVLPVCDIVFVKVKYKLHGVVV